MKSLKNVVQLISERQIDDRYSKRLEENCCVTEDFISRLGLDGELDGHLGCVNTIQWNAAGNLLASGSDDTNLNIWDPLRQKLITSLASGHQGNIFTAKFIPNTEDRNVVTGAADHFIRLHDLTNKETIRVCNCHSGRVKRIDTDPVNPHLFWSAGEDGLILQTDLRVNHTCNQDMGIFVDLKSFIGLKAEAKCLSINPVRTNYIAVGANDPFIRVYDRRLIKLPRIIRNGAESGFCSSGAVSYFVPGHLPQKASDYRKRYRSLAATYLSYSSDGNELLVNLGGEQIYLYQTNITSESTESPLKSYPIAQQFSEDGNIKENLPSRILSLKNQANIMYCEKNYSKAIFLYNLALSEYKNSAILYANRAAALLEREWDGDVYLAMRDCKVALNIYSNYFKAHLRLARSLFQLKEYENASICLKEFEEKFPKQSSLSIFTKLKEDIKNSLLKNASKNVHSNNNTNNFIIEDGEKIAPKFVSLEKKLRTNLIDFKSRFCGHCNTTTDIKEANFFGKYIVAGSDDGSFFIWDKETTNIIKILRGDESIVNCLQPHPSACILATSGIESVIRLWSPLPDEGKENDRLVQDWHEAAATNQMRMNTNPWIMVNPFLLSMDRGDEDEDSDSDNNSNNVSNDSLAQCNPT